MILNDNNLFLLIWLLKLKFLNDDLDVLRKEIKNIKSNLNFKKDKVDKNKKEINFLIKKNSNLSNKKK